MAQFPADLLGVALHKGEVDAITMGDPLAWVVRDRDGLYEVANNLSGEYAHRTCCVLGVRGSLVRDDRAAAGALTQSLLEAQEYVADHPDEAAALFAQYSPVPDRPAGGDASAAIRTTTTRWAPTCGIRSPLTPMI